MSRIEFEENNLAYLYDKSKQAAETFSQSLGDLRTVENEVGAEFLRALAEISNEISYVNSQLNRAEKAKNSIERQIADIKSQIKSVPDIPPAPSSENPQDRQRYAAEKAKAEQERQAVERNNAKCSAEISKLEGCKKELETAILTLERCLRELQTARNTTLAAQSNFETVRSHNAVTFQKSVTDMGLFCNALSDTRERAVEVLRVNERFGFDAWSLRKDFNINSAVYIANVGGTSKRIKSGALDYASEGAAVQRETTRRVLVIKERTREKVNELLKSETGPVTVKIPAANLHPLGGQGFIDYMEANSFILLKKGGSIIGNDGYVTWEK